MTEDEIAIAINPNFPHVYGVTTAPTTLYYKNGDVKAGYFQHTKDSDELKKKNTFTFIEFKNAQEYRATNDKKFVTEVNGDDLDRVFYPKIVRVKYDQIFSIVNNAITPKLPVRIGGVTMGPGVSFGTGVFIGGINLIDYWGKDMEGYLDGNMFVIQKFVW